jgi:hypothetical protein
MMIKIFFHLRLQVRVLSDLCASVLLLVTVIFYILPDASAESRAAQVFYPLLLCIDNQYVLVQFMDLFCLSQVIWCELVMAVLLFMMECADSYLLWNRYEAVYLAVHLGVFQTDSGGLSAASDSSGIHQHLRRMKWAVAVFVFIFFFCLSNAFAMVYPAFVDLNTPSGAEWHRICINYFKPSTRMSFVFLRTAVYRVAYITSLLQSATFFLALALRCLFFN